MNETIFFKNCGNKKKKKLRLNSQRKVPIQTGWLSDQTGHIVLSDLEEHHMQKFLRHASDQWDTVLQSVIG